MSVPMSGRFVRTRDLPDLTRDTEPFAFTALERHLIAERTRDLFRAEPDTTPDPAPPNAELFWMGVLAAAFVLALVMGFLLGATTGQGLHPY